MKHDHIFDMLPKFEAAEPRRLSNERARLKEKAAFKDCPVPILGKPYLYIDGYGKMSYMPPVPIKAKTETINLKIEDSVPAPVSSAGQYGTVLPMDIKPTLTGVYILTTKKDGNKHYSFWNGGYWASTTLDITKASVYDRPSKSVKDGKYAGWECLSPLLKRHLQE